MRSGLDPPPNPSTALAARQLDMELAPQRQDQPFPKGCSGPNWSDDLVATSRRACRILGLAAANRARLPLGPQWCSDRRPGVSGFGA
jgi:hypothetical protein